jgi:hypothetical protein
MIELFKIYFYFCEAVKGGNFIGPERFVGLSKLLELIPLWPKLIIYSRGET